MADLGNLPIMRKGPRRKGTKTTPGDILVQGFPTEVASPADIPPDFVPPTLGSRTALIEKIVEAIPEFDFSDPAWGVLQTPKCRMEMKSARHKLKFGCLPQIYELDTPRLNHNLSFAHARDFRTAWFPLAFFR